MSDLDIGIKFTKKIDMNLYNSILRDLLIEIFKRDEIDVVILNYADPLLRFEIISNCKILYEAHSEAYIN
ncbi:nucleotidyltransferase domain-containing protein [Thermoanaerobacter kivui]|uniref:nucleotidyltransferase domain-containing protein n=1 Tax=Thermoanaerobacter kivui TaxID=2325 RepID=UPI000A659AE7|nr:nucleotidyltransferase domain-containing protein [Thermoanaerobacter kivui]